MSIQGWPHWPSRRRMKLASKRVIFNLPPGSRFHFPELMWSWLKTKKWEAILLPFPRKMLAKIELQLNLSTSKTDIPYTVYLFKYVFIVPKIRRPPKEAHEFLAQPWEKNASYRWDKINLYPKRNMHGDGMACGETTSHRMGCRCDRRAVCWPVDMFSARIIMAVIL